MNRSKAFDKCKTFFGKFFTKCCKKLSIHGSWGFCDQSLTSLTSWFCEQFCGFLWFTKLQTLFLIYHLLYEAGHGSYKTNHKKLVTKATDQAS
jgi:hypothetical protein